MCEPNALAFADVADPSTKSTSPVPAPDPSKVDHRLMSTSPPGPAAEEREEPPVEERALPPKRKSILRKSMATSPMAEPETETETDQEEAVHAVPSPSPTEQVQSPQVQSPALSERSDFRPGDTPALDFEDGMVSGELGQVLLAVLAEHSTRHT